MAVLTYWAEIAMAAIVAILFLRAVSLVRGRKQAEVSEDKESMKP